MNKLEVSGRDYAQKLRSERDLMNESLRKDLIGRIRGILSELGTEMIRRKDELLEEEGEGEPLFPLRYGFEEGNDGYSLERIELVFVEPDGKVGFHLVGDDGRYFICYGVWELLCLFDWVVWCVGTLD